MGQPSLFTPAGEPIRFRTKKHLALLIYLAVEAKTQRRERLAELLWPNVTPTEGRHSLATALSTLRPRLGPQGLETSRDHVRLSPGRVDLDLDRLEAGDVLGTEVSGTLEVAAFLDGFDVVDSPEFNHWKDRQQARLLPAIKDALVVLIDRCRRTGDSRQIERLADRMLALDELSEEAIRAKMEARAFAGDRLTALEFFEEWKKKLADELQAVPSDLVEGMAVRLRRRGWERTTSTNIPTVPTDQWRGRPFIGRTAEYRVLYELWEGAQRGEPGHALILGDSGVGKTTLVEKLTTAAGLEGAAISRVQCYDLEREIPYSTVSSLILGLLDRPGVSATSPESLAELARTVPEVRHRFPNIPASSDSQGEAVRIRLTEAFHEMLGSIADEHPVILVVDDLHLADDVSLAVLHLMMRRARRQPIMVVLIARPGELPQSPQATRLRAAAVGLGIGEMELLPLTENESLDLLKSLIPTDQHIPSSSVQRALLRCAGGYPMVLELLVQDWQTNGEQSLALSVDAMTRQPGAEHPPAIYREILDRITRSLDPNTHNVLNLAALLGQRLNDPSMFGLVDLSLGQTISGMAELVSRRVLRDGARGLEFVNELVRAAAYVGVPVTLRRVLHGEIADRLVQDHDRGVDDLGLEIAWHCIRAERSEQAIPHLLRGARESTLKGAVHAAVRALSSVLPHLVTPEKGQVALLLAELLQEQGRWADSLELLEEDSKGRSLAGMSQVLAMQARFHLYGSAPDRTARDLRTLLGMIENSGDPTLRIAAAGAATTMAASLRDQAWARTLLEALASVPASGLDHQRLTSMSLSRARLMFQRNDHVSSLHEIETATSFLLSPDAISTNAAQFQAGLGAISSKQGEYAKGRVFLEKGYKIAARLGNDSLQGRIAANLALVLGRLGLYADQLCWAEKSLRVERGPSPDYTELLAGYCAAFACISMDLPSRAMEFIESARARITDSLPSWTLQAWLLYSADLYLLLGQQEEAKSEASKATGGVHCVLHVDNFAGPYCRWTARLAIDCGQLSQALKQVQFFLVRLESYDALDRAEILAAMTYLHCRLGFDSQELQSQLRHQLIHLPPPVTDQLRRVGMLDAFQLFMQRC
jgi:DNA-binding SARP family transcriptional activator/tetratricopeptide (TPR) repeat protein/type II secretory pathway predicted ATPase ExeA